MTDTQVFVWVCNEIESATSLNSLETRGTVRIALKSAGLDPRTATSDQVAVVLRKVLPQELEARGIADAEALCDGLAQRVVSEAGGNDASAPDSPELVFQRLGG